MSLFEEFSNQFPEIDSMISTLETMVNEADEVHKEMIANPEDETIREEFKFLLQEMDTFAFSIGHRYSELEDEENGDV